MRDVIRATLEQDGYHVFHAADGEAALDLLASGPSADILVTDANLPDTLNGWVLARLFSAVRPGRRVVYVSGDRAGPALPVENSVFLPKPFRAAQMLEAVVGLACAP